MGSGRGTRFGTGVLGFGLVFFLAATGRSKADESASCPRGSALGGAESEHLAAAFLLRIFSAAALRICAWSDT